MRIILIILLGFTVLSCQQSGTTQPELIAKNSSARPDIDKFSLAGTLNILFNRGLTEDSTEYSNAFKVDTPSLFLFFKSGYILDRNNKNAFVVICPTDSTCLIRLYNIRNNEWQLIDSLSGLESYPIQFEAVFNDYNFDNQTDIYVQVTASNGWSLSRGHLLTIDPQTKKMTNHPEARELANMQPDSTTKTVVSELSNGYNLKNQLELIMLKNKWIKGQLKTVSKKDTVF